ncbi:hypothetical protein BUALT_Bualt11G0123100 [Buddleja alternifolia]|uniref:Proteasome inhibitor PI31 subunit n=1 Tax=Buddleja alternifolia TaxID=168488 RepID=A0AAV6WUI3_9LAMI|nr:hypothetical protein BUALT_Bualt11G0123100 [Buddleja alternifolia]
MATEQSIMAVIRAARPSFRSRHDKAAFAIHAAFLSAGYVLNSAGAAAFSDDALSASTADEVGMDNWNEVEDNYAFVYSNSEKDSRKVLLKCLVLKDKLLVDALKEGDSKPLHLEVDVGEYVEDNGGTNYGSQYKNLGKLVTNVNEQILGKLGGASAASSSSQSSSSQRNPRDDRDRPITGVADPEEPYYSSPSGFIVPPIPSFGGSDLYPGPGAGMYPTRGGFGGGSMLVGPQDPRFFGGISDERGLPGGLRGVPPGARFDPYGPPGVPGFEPGRFVRRPRGPGGGTHPDLHHFHDGSDFI